MTERLDQSAYMFWCVAKQLREWEREYGPPKDILQALDEIDVLADYTEWPQILTRCNEVLPKLRRKKELAT